ncbi:TIGR03086 family metal-binding protein [Nocardia sp. XZ_19_385]|uniref:TIGR03086 family metal-binding protein n=1 Tax=Nocardia sp. XZ_19_385 TaxID=2769488 RepID=UPI00188FD34A|nr:TIGR03086 family metal-binding protein [Nocardia sp. XZ_19_385]
MTSDSTVQADLRTLHARVIETSIDVVDEIAVADLSKPTPCADWTLHGLLTHMIAQHYGFAAAVQGNADLERWKPRRLGSDPAASYRAAAEHARAAFAEPGVLERQCPLPEFGPDVRVAGAQALSFHFVDYVVHSWDVAKTLGFAVHFDDEVLAAARQVAAAVPGGEMRSAPGAAFGPEVPWPDAVTLDSIVAMLGRSPSWPDVTA